MCDDFFDDFGLMDIGLAGALSEEMCEEEKKRIRLEQEMQTEDEPRCCNDDDPYE